MIEHHSTTILEAISKTLEDAIEGTCSCSVAPAGQGYLGHAQGCGVNFSRRHLRRTARFLAEEFKKRDLSLMEKRWADDAAAEDDLEDICKRVGVDL